MTKLITPKSKIAEILSNYPELEEIFIKFAPEFEKLKNPILRKIVAKLTTLEQAAKIANVDLGKLINTLRKAVGQDTIENIDASTDVNFETFDKTNVIEHFDARPLLNAGNHPVHIVMDKLSKLETNQILCLITPFKPFPLIEMAKQRNFKIMLEELEADLYYTYFKKY